MLPGNYPMVAPSIRKRARKSLGNSAWVKRATPEIERALVVRARSEAVAFLISKAQRRSSGHLRRTAIRYCTPDSLTAASTKKAPDQS